MTWLALGFGVLLGSSMMLGCARPAPTGTQSPGGASSSQELGPADADEPQMADFNPEAATPAAGVGEDKRPLRPVPARGEPGWLPEVKVENVGFHIGGGPNDPQTAAPFKRALEREFNRFLRCYREVKKPGEGGTFGVDLFIPRQGGHPEVRQPRTGMTGEDFKNCMIEAFAAASFERPSLGPTVLSYSVRFRVDAE